ncbi:uncharacterized protein LOC143285848 [Babylonia areolata]|uniref:uncharacterized protein LOC143285848 n=1 Tax=Babylonia areolata TaxID=304850 RepID=UPI003FD3078A
MASDKAIFDDDDCDDNNNTAPDSVLLDSQPSCLKCGQMQRMMKCCTRCHAAFYCSKTCFAKHWPLHKKNCQPQSKSQEQVERESGEGDRTVYRVIQHIKPTARPVINFQKAANDLTTTAAAASPKQETKPQPPKNSDSSDPEPNDAMLPGVDVTVRYNKQKHKFKVCDAWDSPTIFSKLSSFLACLPDNMRVIHKGKQLGADSIRSAVGSGAVFQVLGERMEDASGLVPKDIDVLMRQMGVERNVAVRALRQCGGDLIDAMMVVGNK